MAIYVSKSAPTDGTVSGNTADHPPGTHWLISALAHAATKWPGYDIETAVPGPDPGYWKNDANSLVLMSSGEQDVVNDARLEANRATRIALARDRTTELKDTTGFTSDLKVFPLFIQGQVSASSYKNSAVDFTFPFDIDTFTGEKYSLTNAHKVQFKTDMNAALVAFNSAETTLLDDLATAADQTALDAIIDAR